MAEVDTTQDKPENQDKPEIDGEDLALVDDRLEDDAKTDSELWDELEEEEAAAADDTDPDKLSGADDAADAAAAAEDDTTAQQPDDKKPSEQEQPAADAAGTQNNGDNDDIWSSATPQQRDAFEAAQAELKKLGQAERGNRGRISSLQRKVNDLLAQRSSDPDDSGAGGGDDISASDILQSPTWKSMTEEYPEIAGPLEAVLGKLTSAVESQGDALSSMGDERNDALIAQQEALLDEQHPDWEKIRDAEEFGKWLFEQPDHIINAARVNAEGIVDARQAADVISRFKAARSAQEDATANNGGGNGTEQEPNPDNGKGGESTLSDRRTRQLEAASSTRTTGPGAITDTPPDDADDQAHWDHFERLEAQERRQA